MPAGLPGSTHAANIGGNPSAGNPVIFDSLSGPKGSPLDTPGQSQASTGAMCTGIGYGLNVLLGLLPGLANAVSIERQGFNDDQNEARDFTDSSIIYIGGGKCTATANGVAPAVPYTDGFFPGSAGNGGSRDAGAGPAFTSFAHKMVTASGSVAPGAVIETGFVNRCGVALVANQSTFGSASAAQAAPA